MVMVMVVIVIGNTRTDERMVTAKINTETQHANTMLIEFNLGIAPMPNAS